MDEITKIAVKRTIIDPMQEIMKCLFEKRGDIFISDELLNLIKTNHSYTLIPCGNTNVYNFYKRIRGTDTIYSFIVTTGPEGNRVSELECVAAEFGIVRRNKETIDATLCEKVFLILHDE